MLRIGSMTMLLAGFRPYLSDQLNADVVYWGELR